MKKPVFTIGGVLILIIFFALIKACTSTSPPQQVKKESVFIDSKYESDWQDGTGVSDYDSLASHLSQHNIPCGEIYVKESNEATGSYLCACRVDITDPWSYYQIWLNVSDVIPVQSYKVLKKPNVK